MQSVVGVRGSKKQNTFLETRILWNDAFSDVYVQNLQNNIQQVHLSENLSKQPYNVNDFTEKMSWCLVDAASFLQQTYIKTNRVQHREQWHEKECSLAKRRA